MNKPPKRLLDDPSTTAALRRDLLKVQQSAANYDTKQGLASLEAAIAAQGAPGSPTSNPGASPAPQTLGASISKSPFAGLPTKWGLLAALGLGGALAVGVWLGARPQAEGTPATAPSHEAPPPVLQPSPPSTAPSTAPPPALKGGGGMEEAPVQGRSGTKGTRPAGADPAGLHQAEIANLQRVRALLAQGRASAAYRAARDGQGRFGKRSILYEEREALAIMALSSMGNTRLAARRARRFVTRFPKSPLRAQVIDAGRLPTAKNPDSKETSE